MILSICAGAGLIFFGYAPLGKGLILGALFSVFNFLLLSSVASRRFVSGARTGKLHSVGSILLRYAILALPLILASRLDQLAVSTTAAGLFMVQIAMVGDQVWGRLRKTGGYH